MANKNGWRDLSFQGKSAVFTGAARGIGRAVAYRLAGLGARTVIWDLDGEVAEQAAGELRQLLASQGRANRLEWKQVDITDPETVAARWRRPHRETVSMSWSTTPGPRT